MVSVHSSLLFTLLKGPGTGLAKLKKYILKIDQMPKGVKYYSLNQRGGALFIKSNAKGVELYSLFIFSYNLFLRSGVTRCCSF